MAAKRKARGNPEARGGKKLRVEVTVTKTDELTVEATVDGLIELGAWLEDLDMENGDAKVTAVILTN